MKHLHEVRNRIYYGAQETGVKTKNWMKLVEDNLFGRVFVNATLNSARHNRLFHTDRQPDRKMFTYTVFAQKVEGVDKKKSVCGASWSLPLLSSDVLEQTRYLVPKFSVLLLFSGSFTCDSYQHCVMIVSRRHLQDAD